MPHCRSAVNRWSRTLLAVVLIVAAFGLSGTATSQTSELVFASPDDIRSTDPHAVFASRNMQVLRNVWEPLLNLTNAGFQGHLATNWTISQDNLTYTFTLRDDVRFADGTPFTADAVKATFDRIAGNSGLGYHFIFLNVEETVVVDDHTVEVRLSSADGSFLFNLITVYILPAHFQEPTEGTPWEATNNFGTGPFTIVEWERNRSLILAANTDYWQPGLPRVDRLVVRPIPEETTRVAALRTGEVHIADGISLDSAQLLAQDPDIRTESAQLWQANFLQMNTLRPPLDDVRVRQAINIAIDREVITDFVLGAGEPLATYPPVGILGHHDGIPSNPYDLARARELIQEALPGGHQGTLTLYAVPGAPAKADEILQVLASQLAEIGLNVEPRMTEPGAFNQMRESGNYDLAFFGSAAVTGDAGRYFVERILLDRYRSGWVNEEAFDLIRTASQETNPDRVSELYRQLQVIMFEEVPIAYVYQQDWMIGIRNDVDGFELTPHRLDDIYRAGFRD